jgi:hypothetical protein
MGELKTVDIKAKSFTTTKYRYHIVSTLPIDRYIAYCKMQLEVGFDVTFLGIIKALQDVCIMANGGGRNGEIYALAHNTLNGIEKINDRRIPVLTLCALFILREDEDIIKIDEQIMQEKIDDWAEEGIETSFFLKLAVNLIQGYEQIRNAITPNILNPLAEEKEKNMPHSDS